MKKLATPEKRNIVLDGRRTTLQLEYYCWQNAAKISADTNQTLDELLNAIWRRKASMAMAPAVRLFLMLYYTDYAERVSEDTFMTAAQQNQNGPEDQEWQGLRAAEPQSAPIRSARADDSFAFALKRLYEVAAS